MNAAEMMQIDPQVYELCLAIERLGSGEEQTKLSALAAELHNRVRRDARRIAALEKCRETLEMVNDGHHLGFAAQRKINEILAVAKAAR